MSYPCPPELPAEKSAGVPRTFADTVGVREIGTGRLILCAVPVLVGVVSYFFTAVKFKVITHEDCLLLPKGEKIAKILKL